MAGPGAIVPGAIVPGAIVPGAIVPGATVSRMAALIRHNATLILREPGPLVSRMVLPVVFLVLLHPLYQVAEGDAAGTRQAVIATVITFSLLALSIVGGSILTERAWHTWERLRATPAGSAEVLAGKAVPVLAALLGQQAIIIGFGAAVLGLAVIAPLLLALAVLAWTLALLGIGSLLGVLARSLSELSAAYDIGAMILSSLGGGLVPLSALPGWVRDSAPVSPGYWGVESLRAAMLGQAGRTLTACAVLAGFGLAAAALAGVRAGRGWGRSSRM
jgi:ABC-2 type transport system permease protein